MSGLMKEDELRELRREFEVFQHGDGLLDPETVYLDSAATMLKPKIVLDETRGSYVRYFSNPRRGLYRNSAETTEKIEKVRADVAAFIGARDRSQIVFTMNATQSLNLAAELLLQKYGAAAKVSAPADAHHSLILPFSERFSDVELSDERNDGAGIRAESGMSNVTGRMPEFASATVVDAAQEIAHRPVNVSARPCEFLAFSGHKIGAEMGIGVLYLADPEKWRPAVFGGEMIESVGFRDGRVRPEFAAAPEKFEAGTLNAGGIVSLGAAIGFWQGFGLEKAFSHIDALTEYTKEKILEHPERFELFFAEHGVVLMNIRGVHPHDAAQLLSEKNVMVRSGFHCAEPFFQKNRLRPALRISLAAYNSTEEIDFAADAMLEAAEKMHV